jgi:hypothetical protein
LFTSAVYRVRTVKKRLALKHKQHPIGGCCSTENSNRFKRSQQGEP